MRKLFVVWRILSGPRRAPLFFSVVLLLALLLGATGALASGSRANGSGGASSGVVADLGVLTSTTGSTLFTWDESPDFVMAEWWNDPAGAGCMYASNPWPQGALAAQRAYVLAARSVLLNEWSIDSYIAHDEPTGSEARIHGTETGCFGGHIDYPPHIHILYLWSPTASTWQLINSHFHMGDQGLVYDQFVIPDVCGQNTSYTAPPGQWVDILDQSCSAIWQQEYTSGGDIELRRSPSAPVYTLRIRSVEGDLASVDVLLDGAVIYNASVTAYDPVHYEMTAQTSDFRGNRLTTETWQGDPSTGSTLTSHSAQVAPLTETDSHLYVPFVTSGQ